MELKTYYVNRIKTAPNNNYYEIHTGTCDKTPSQNNREYLGLFDRYQHALIEAKKSGYSKINSCIHCCSPRHKG